MCSMIIIIIITSLLNFIRSLVNSIYTIGAKSGRALALFALLVVLALECVFSITCTCTCIHFYTD